MWRWAVAVAGETLGELHLLLKIEDEKAFSFSL